MVNVTSQDSLLENNMLASTKITLIFLSISYEDGKDRVILHLPVHASKGKGIND